MRVMSRLEEMKELVDANEMQKKNEHRQRQ